MALRRRSSTPGVEGGPAVSSDPTLTVLAPTLHEFLTLVQWPDGAKRKTGTVMLLCEDGVWKVWLHDRDGNCSSWVSAGSLADLLDACERGLTDESLNWRQNKPQGKR